jgi:RNA polymerase sigma-70 factor (ECF subfamily)
MPDPEGDPLIRLLYQAAGGERAAVSDGALLERFVASKDEAAFELLVRRHGPMVFGVCRRVLRHEQDAEDAFQATFLVLAHKAGAVRPREAVGHWLYGVAYRTALKARTAAARRRRREQMAPHAASPVVAAAESSDDWRSLLDEAVQALPGKYRTPVVLCELEGLSRKEVAARLTIPQGTLSSRLAAARQLLARRLARRGVTVPAAALGAALVPEGAGASVPVSLVNQTVRAAASIARGQMAAGVASAQVVALTKGVMRNMALVKVRSALVVACLVGIAAGAGWLAYGSLAAEPPPPAATAPAAARKGEEPRKEDATAALRKKKLQAAEQVYILRLKHLIGGTDNRAEDLYAWSKRWLESETEVNDGREARLKALRAHLDRMKELEKQTRERVEAGLKNFRPEDASAAEYARTEAEIWLKAEEEKK